MTYVGHSAQHGHSHTLGWRRAVEWQPGLRIRSRVRVDLTAEMIRSRYRESMPDSAVERWQSEGWALVERMIPTEEVAAARAEIRPRDNENIASGDSTVRADEGGGRFRAAQFDGTTLFPYPDAPNLNRLFVHPSIVKFAQQALTTEDLRIYQSRIWSKYGGHTNYEQSHHVDGNHSPIPILHGSGFGHIEFFVFLDDTNDTNGAPRVVPRSVTGHATNGVGNGRSKPAIEGECSIEEAPNFYEGEISVGGPAGSVLAYRSDVWHRGTDLELGTERHVLGVSFRSADAPWITFDSHGPLVSRPDFIRFVEASSPDDLALFGVPLPGHAYWTAEILDAMARHYPGLDLTPWLDPL